MFVVEKIPGGVKRHKMRGLIVVLSLIFVALLAIIGASWRQYNEPNNQAAIDAEKSEKIPVLSPDELSETEITDDVKLLEESHEEKIARLRNTKIAALTFDDGPFGETTDRLLDVLYEKKVFATFFMLGSRAQAEPEIVREVSEIGHEIGSHTMRHKNLVKIPRNQVEAEVREADVAICNILGREQNCIKYVRPPYGNTNGVVAQVVARPMIGWNIDTEDWKSKNPEEIKNRAVDAARDSAVLLMHDIYETTVDAVGPIIDAYKENGYEFVTISELIEIRGEELGNGILYGKFEPRF